MRSQLPIRGLGAVSQGHAADDVVAMKPVGPTTPGPVKAAVLCKASIGTKAAMQPAARIAAPTPVHEDADRTVWFMMIPVLVGDDSQPPPGAVPRDRLLNRGTATDQLYDQRQLWRRRQRAR